MEAPPKWMTPGSFWPTAREFTSTSSWFCLFVKADHRPSMMVRASSGGTSRRACTVVSSTSRPSAKSHCSKCLTATSRLASSDMVSPGAPFAEFLSMHFSPRRQSTESGLQTADATRNDCMELMSRETANAHASKMHGVLRLRQRALLEPILLRVLQTCAISNCRTRCLISLCSCLQPMA